MKTSTPKRIKKREFVPIFKRTVLVFALILMIVYLASLLLNSSVFYSESASMNALLHLDRDLEVANNLADEHFDDLYAIADQLQYADSKSVVDEVVYSYIGDDRFGDLRYYSNGQTFSAQGTVVTTEVNDALYALSESKKAGATAVYFDMVVEKDCIALFVPVRGSAYVDGLLSILPARELIVMDTVLNETACCTAIVKPEDGRILSGVCADDFSTSLGSNLYDFISTLTSDNYAVQSVTETISNHEKGTCTVDAFGVSYTVAVAPMDTFDGHILLVSVSISDQLTEMERTFINHIISVMAIAVVALIVSLVYAILYYRKTRRELSEALLTDPTLECANDEQFRRDALRVIYASKSNYAIVACTVRQYGFLYDNLGEQKTIEMLKYIVKVLESSGSGNETFAYSGDGKFMLLMQHTSDRAIRGKIHLFEAIINKLDILRETHTVMKFNVGVYHVFAGVRRRTVPEMMECASLACDYAKSNVNDPFVVYTETVNAEIARGEKIEAQMETALENHDFKLFLQPKYNVARDCIDSAEALVRWFDPNRGDYLFPAEFIELFETNGFIVKLDKFIYMEVLNYLSRATERGEKIVPVSVNVSRVTAMSDDFLDFYVGQKKLHRIGDGFLTLEFTESFAMENYEKIADIVEVLHNNGMRCSIDDFGVGYSSFNILKQIPMDELKLDRLFLAAGKDSARDRLIIEAVMKLAKSLKMSIVQEGVETKELFDLVVGLGCDVVQGYYYAKALPLEEYRIFLNSNTSIKYKSLVK